MGKIRNIGWHWPPWSPYVIAVGLRFNVQCCSNRIAMVTHVRLLVSW